MFLSVSTGVPVIVSMAFQVLNEQTKLAHAYIGK